MFGTLEKKILSLFLTPGPHELGQQNIGPVSLHSQATRFLDLDFWHSLHKEAKYNIVMLARGVLYLLHAIFFAFNYKCWCLNLAEWRQHTEFELSQHLGNVAFQTLICSKEHCKRIATELSELR